MKMYAKNENGMIYEVKAGKICDNYLDVNLKLVCGIDYINPDENNIQGYVGAERFVEQSQRYYEICYFYDESVKECLEENGYEVIYKLPEIHHLKAD